MAVLKVFFEILHPPLYIIFKSKILSDALSVTNYWFTVFKFCDQLDILVSLGSASDCMNAVVNKYVSEIEDSRAYTIYELYTLILDLIYYDIFSS